VTLDVAAADLLCVCVFSVILSEKQATVYQQQFHEIESYALKRQGRAVTLKMADKVSVGGCRWEFVLSQLLLRRFAVSLKDHSSLCNRPTFHPRRATRSSHPSFAESLIFTR
jgi:hypothetical protein